MEPNSTPRPSTTNRRTTDRRRRTQGGNAIIEFAICWFVLWMSFSGIYEFGEAFYIYNRLETAVGSAAELGAKLGYDTGNPSTYTTALQNMVLYGDETAGTSTIVPGINASNVSVSVTLDTNGIPRDVTVSVVNYTLNALFGSFTLAKPRASAVYYGQVSCSTC